MAKDKEKPAQEEILAETGKKAFIITPIGPNSSDIRRAANGVIDAVIEPILIKHNIEIIVPHRIDDLGSINNQIINYILNVDLVIANLTGLNPNVMYELAIRHAKRLPVIIIAEQGTKLPFDINTERTFFYTNDMADVQELTKQLDRTIPLALNDKKPSNPIYNAISDNLIKEQVNKDGSEFEKYALSQLQDLSESISYLKNNLSFTPKGSGSSGSIFLSNSNIGSISNNALSALISTQLISNIVNFEFGRDLAEFGLNKTAGESIDLAGLGPIQVVGAGNYAGKGVLLVARLGNMFGITPSDLIKLMK